MKTIPVLLVSLVLVLDCASSQTLQGRLVTSAFGWQRHDTVGTSSNHLYGYQTVQLSLTKGDYSVSTYLQGWNDFSGPTKNNGTIRLYNLYFKWRNIGDLADLTVGRQMVAAGVGIGTIDGVHAAGRFLGNKLKVVGYAGPLVPPALGAQTAGRIWDNSLYGGQIVGSPVEFGQVSLSYMKRQLKPDAYTALRRDSLFNPLLVEIRPSASIEEFVSGDISVEHSSIFGYVRYDYDVQLEKTARWQSFARFKPIERVGVTAEYVKREPRISYNSVFAAFTYNSLQEYEFGLEYDVEYISNLQVFGKYGAVDYDDETSRQYTFGAHWKYVSASATSISGYNGRINAGSLNAGYPLFEKKLTPTIMVGYGRYKLNRYVKRELALNGALGVVYRPMPALSLDTQVQWMQNKIYKNDVRVFFRASYLLNERLTVF